MKKQISIILVCLIFSTTSMQGTFWGFMRKLPVVGQHISPIAKKDVATLENLNILTIRPVSECPEPQKRTIDEVSSSIKEGENATNNNKCVTIYEMSEKEQSFDLSTTLPSDYNGTIAIYVSGYAGLSGNARYKYAGSGAYGTFNYLKADLMSKDWIYISFDGLTNYRSYFNFGQQLDQDCLNTVYEATIQKNPRAKIVLFGSCKGSTTILNYLTNPNNKYKKFDEHIKAVLLESPSISLDSIVLHIARNHVPKPLQFILPYLFAATFPSYQWKQKTMIDYTANLPNNIPILIGYLQQDKTANYQDILKIVDSFLKAGKNNVHVFKSNNTELLHGHLSKANDFQEKARKFFAESVGTKLE